MGSSSCSELIANTSSSRRNVAGRRSSLNRKRGEARVVRRKVQKLRWLVPGGRGLRREHLFLKTAHYILNLRFQVCALQAILKLQDEG